MLNKKSDVHAAFLMTSEKVMSNNCALCFNRTEFVVVP